jgi:hypothetical protein
MNALFVQMQVILIASHPPRLLPTQVCYGDITICIRLCDFEGR